MVTKYNRTPDGELACAFGTPWEDHFTRKGCPDCDRETNAALKEKYQKDTKHEH
jgi:hypothetical protein